VRTAAGIDFTKGACDTLEQAYYHTLRGIHLTRNRAAHEAAALMAAAAGGWPGNQVYIRLESPTQPRPPPFIQIYDEESREAARDYIEPLRRHQTIICPFDCYLRRKIPHLLRKIVQLLRRIFHKLFVASNVSFTQGPATVMNDLIYNTHEGKYANMVLIIRGQLSAQLTFWGKIFAFLNLNWIIALIAAAVALPTAAWISDKTSKIIAGAIAVALLL